ncbi:predicted protein [Nematostella vectensis]|uniref:Teneurin-like YD-shell domain-containing protein n=1 Tax=Nematostella vectensis TaxID=45351 RepID=A7TBN8_NEMVE|nr:predicted protein [Nematostella vectensis]|eukprot:XP_001618668.1 hypothetical protein NEMVEDRAFT_v1g224920 [Nematostella vectensis]
MIKSSLKSPAANGVKLSIEVALTPSTDGSRYLSIGLGNATGDTRGLWATFQDGDVYAVAQTKPLSSAENTRVLTNRLGPVVDNTTYIVEVQAHTSGSILHVYPKGQSRETGYSFATQIAQLTDLQFTISGRSGSSYGNSISYLDNIALAAGGIQVGTGSPFERYLHKDHLGSIVAVTDNQGVLLERSSYDAWGKRRNLDGTDDQSFDQLGQGLLPSLSTHHGFTGHEMLDDMSLVHMNGRLYDPIIARFVSSDPFIDTLYSTQGLNSYSYVLNNPLNATDPDGYFSLKKAFKKLKSGFKKFHKVAHAEFKFSSGILGAQKASQFMYSKMSPQIGGMMFAVEDAQHGIFPKKAGHDGYADIHITLTDNGAEAPILRNTPFRNIQLGQYFYPGDNLVG